MATACNHGQASVVRTSTFFAALALALTGCYTAHEPGGGGIILMDSGPGVRDAGGPIRPDAGPPPPIDAGPIACSSETVEPYAGPEACSEAVRGCLRECESSGSEDCAGECIASEPLCQSCFYQTLIACSNRSGCLDDWRAFACCTDRAPGCGGRMGVDRLDCAGACPAEIDRYSSCLNETDPDTCFIEAATTCNLGFPG